MLELIKHQRGVAHPAGVRGDAMAELEPFRTAELPVRCAPRLCAVVDGGHTGDES
jgi:hypothetical protein